MIGPDGNRDNVCDFFERWVKTTMSPAVIDSWKQQLRGKDLVCFCKPQRCHGDFLLKLVNTP